MNSPFKFLDPYTFQDRDVFFGREEETEALYSMVFQTPMLLLYGLSGTGKTSLVQCGLASKFDGTDWYPFYLRRQEDINESLQRVIEEAFPEGETMRDTLPGNVSVLFRYYLRPVYLIFDQFEELFILGNQEEQEKFARSLRALIEEELPCKIILVMREEFIGQMYHLERVLPSLFDFRLRVEPMGYKKVGEVVLKSCDKFGIALEEPQKNIQQIYDNISAGRSGVQLPYLQVYLDMLYREGLLRAYPETKELPKPLPSLQFTTLEIEKFGRIEDVLSRFLQIQERLLAREALDRFRAVPDNAVRVVLDTFVTEEGTKRPVRYFYEGDQIVIKGQAADWLAHLPEEVVSFVIQRLAAIRLLRIEGETIELAHDSLAALIDSQRSEKERRLNEALQQLKISQREYEETGALLSRRQLNRWEEAFSLLGQRLSPEMEAFIQKSFKAVEQQEQAALQIERRKRKRAIWIAIAGVLLALVAIAASFQAWKKTRETNRAKNLITENAFDLRLRFAEKLKVEGKYEEALAQLDSARILFPDIGQEEEEALNTRYQNWREVWRSIIQGDQYREARNFHQAVLQYEKALAASPDARIQELINETRSSLQDRFIKLMDSGKAMLTAGQYRQAVEQFSTALELKPDDQEAKQKLQEAQRLLNN